MTLKVMKPMSVMLAILAVDGEVHSDLLGRTMDAMAWLMTNARGSRLEVRRIVGARPVDFARNTAVEQFLQSGCDWLVQIDHDTVPERPDFLSIIPMMEDEGKQVCTLLTPAYIPSSAVLTYNCWHLLPNGIVHGSSALTPGWSQWSLLGSACLVVHRSVFQRLTQPWFRRVKDTRELLKPEQDREYSGVGGEDFYFSTKCRAAGFRLWVHSDYRCRHHKKIDLLPFLEQVNALRASQPARH